jgi:hypothetical protein
VRKLLFSVVALPVVVRACPVCRLDVLCIQSFALERMPLLLLLFGISCMRSAAVATVLVFFFFVLVPF